MELGLVAALATVSVMAAALFEGRRMKCPSCGGWFARRSAGRSSLGSRSRQESRYVITSPGGDHSYSHSLQVTYDDQEFRYSCKKCGHHWSDLESRTSTPFAKSSPYA